MKKAICFVVSFTAFYFLVLTPIEADLTAALARHFPLSNTDKAMLYYRASQLDNCNGHILNSLGDAYVSDNNAVMAATAYGKAMECSPGNSLMRFKFGESLLLMGAIEGKVNIEEAVRLEPNNPYYLSEIDRLTKLLQR